MNSINNENRLILIGVSLFFGLALIFNSLFLVNENENVIVVAFGKVQKTITNAGLNAKIPFIHKTIKIDKRLLEVESPAKELLSADQKRLIVDAFAKYKISNSHIFFQTLYKESVAAYKIKSILDSSLRRITAQYTLADFLTNKRSVIMDQIENEMKEKTKVFGIDIIDVRLIRTDLPIENSESVFKRMMSERKKEANELRATGYEMATKIKSTADKKAHEIRYNAELDAKRIMSEADRNANNLYIKTFSQDREFFLFYQKMEFYKKTFNNKSTKLIINTSDPTWKEFFTVN